MIQFLQQHWRLILEGCFALFTLVFFILKKKPTTDIFSFIFERCLAAIQLAEDSGSTSIEKLTIAIAYVNDSLVKKFPDIHLAEYQYYIKKFIESILATPQKKSK